MRGESGGRSGGRRRRGRGRVGGGRLPLTDLPYEVKGRGSRLLRRLIIQIKDETLAGESHGVDEGEVMSARGLRLKKLKMGMQRLARCS